MSNAVAQSATVLTPSTSFDDWDYMAGVRKVAARKLPANTLTIISLDMAYSKLVSGTCRDIRDAFPSLFAKRDEKGNIVEGINRLPDNVFNKVVETVNQFIDETIKSVFTDKPDELVRCSSRPVAKKDMIVVRHTLIRDEIVSIEHQITYCNAFISETERALKKIENQQAVPSEITMEREKKLRKKLESLNERLLNLKEKKARLAGLEKKA